MISRKSLGWGKMAEVKDYLQGIERDLKYVVPMRGHEQAKISILAQARIMSKLKEKSEELIVKDVLDYFYKHGYSICKKSKDTSCEVISKKKALNIWKKETAI